MRHFNYVLNKLFFKFFIMFFDVIVVLVESGEGVVTSHRFFAIYFAWHNNFIATIMIENVGRRRKRFQYALFFYFIFHMTLNNVSHRPLLQFRMIQ